MLSSKYECILIKSLAVVLFFSVSTFGRDLLINGNFESGIVKGHFVNGYPDGWDGWNQNGWHHADSGYKRDGYGIAIWSNDTGCLQVIAASGGDQFNVSCEMIYPAAEPLTKKNGLLIIEFWDGPDPTGAKLSESRIGILTPSHNSNTWYTFSDTVTAPAGTTEARIVCRTESTGGGSTGKSYWDNVVVDDLQVTNDPDYDNSQTVDLLDFAKLAGVWMQSSSTYNLTGDEFIDLEDLQLFANAWQTQITPHPGYELAWSDEFYGPVLNTQNWVYETGTRGDGWGNWEWQYYTDRPENCRIENGVLVIEARRENYGGMDYTSSRIKTQGKQSFQYGRIEARIKMPAGGHAIWPAFWMLGNNITSVGWPTCGEMDIVEMMSDPAEALGTIHYGNLSGDHASQGGSYSSGGNLSSNFNIYAFEWDETGIRWYCNGSNYFTASNWTSNAGDFPAPFNQPFFIILNFAVGAWWWDKDTTDSSVSFPQQFLVDYVRVYQKTTP